MNEIIDFEIKTFFFFVLHSMGILFFHDLLSAWRRAVTHGAVWMGLEDLFFWLAVSFRTFVLIFLYQDGVLRLYTLAAMGLGVFFYRRAVGGCVVNTVSGLLTGILCFLGKIRSKIDAFRQKTVAKIVKKGYTENSNLERNVSL